jgi:serine/threonine-protein phosphatase CPPED1
MTIRRFSVALAFAGTLAAQTFIQMSDPQFGMYTKNAGFAQETANFEFAIATANRLRPAFVVITGDLINEGGNAAQAAEYHRIAAKLDPGIHLYQMPGNHDVGNDPTPESVAAYGQGFGPDYYTFREGDIAGFVLDSSLEKVPQNVPVEAAKMESWLRAELAKARSEGARQFLVFQHIPFFIGDVNEPDSYDNIPRETRLRYLKLLHEYGVRQVFAGHYHTNAAARDGDLEMVTSGPVGMPLKGGKSGIRIVTVADGKVSHKYYDFGELP